MKRGKKKIFNVEELIGNQDIPEEPYETEPFGFMRDEKYYCPALSENVILTSVAYHNLPEHKRLIKHISKTRYLYVCKMEFLSPEDEKYVAWNIKVKTCKTEEDLIIPLHWLRHKLPPQDYCG